MRLALLEPLCVTSLVFGHGSWSSFELRMANSEFKDRELDPGCLLLATLSKKAGDGPALLDSGF